MTGPDWWTPPWTLGSDADPDTGWNTASRDRPSDETERVDGEGAHDSRWLTHRVDEQFGQVRSRDRVRDLAEVFTHQREVDAILDLVPDAFAGLDVKFLEPACGSGNFLTEIVRRKLALVSRDRCTSQEHYEHRMLRAAASIYGVDISPQNIAEARARTAHVLLDHYQADANTSEATTGFLSALVTILGANIVAVDTLAGARDIELCDWRPHPGGRFQRVWSAALVPPAERDLFWSERVQDDRPVHYSRLADGSLHAPTGAVR